MRYSNLHDLAAKKIRSKKRFYKHFAAYLAAAFFFFFMNIATYNPWDGFWFFFPLIPWGAVLLLHRLWVFGFPITGALTEQWEEREMKKELRKLYETVPMVDDEFEDLSVEERLELKEYNRLKNKWEGDQFV